MKLHKIISLIILLLLISLLFVSGVVRLQNVTDVFLQNADVFLHLLIIYAGCIIFAPALGAFISAERKMIRGIVYLLAGLASAGAALLALFTLKFAIGEKAAVIIAVFVSVLMISVVFIISNARGHKKTVDRLEERGVRTVVIKRRTAIKNAYALFFENSGSIASFAVALYLAGEAVVLGKWMDFTCPVEMLVALLCVIAAVALIGNLVALWIER